jgi:DNA-binding CsgD family transcriptional regulator
MAIVHDFGQAITRRELQVLRKLADGLRMGEIARQLSISILTARDHVKALREKLGARNNWHIVAIAYEKGILIVGSKDCVDISTNLPDNIQS